VSRHFLAVLVSIAGVVLSSAQQTPPKVKVNVLNVCSPSAEEQQQIASALARVPKQPLFSADFEVDRGQSNLEERPGFLQPGSGAQPSASSDPALASWVRVRREFAVQATFATVQYSFSLDSKDMVETLVFHVREPKDLLEISIEDRASAVTTPVSMLSASTPASHIKLERFGKPSIVLARCTSSDGGPPPDQTAYEPLFQSATGIVTNYRNLLQAQRTVPDELARVGVTAAATKSASKPASKLRKPATPQK
jgi:hypothetical protein